MVFTRPIIACLMAFIATKTFANAAAGIQYTPGFHPSSPSTDGNEHAIFVAGDINGYSITPLEFDDFHQYSSAVCGHLVANSAHLGYNDQPLYTGQCSTNVKKHDQNFMVQCLDPKNPKVKKDGSLIIRFKSSGVAEITTTKNAWAGFTNEPRKSALRVGQITSTSTGVGAFVSCYGIARIATQ